jgi:hypothetical protein
MVDDDNQVLKIPARQPARPKSFYKEEFRQKKNKSFAKDLVPNYKIIAGEDLIKKWWRG